MSSKIDQKFLKKIFAELDKNSADFSEITDRLEILNPKLETTWLGERKIKFNKYFSLTLTELKTKRPYRDNFDPTYWETVFFDMFCQREDFPSKKEKIDRNINFVCEVILVNYDRNDLEKMLKPSQKKSSSAVSSKNKTGSSSTPTATNPSCSYCTGKGKKGNTVPGCTSTQCKAWNHVLGAHNKGKGSVTAQKVGKLDTSNDIPYNREVYVVLEANGKLYCRIKSSIK